VWLQGSHGTDVSVAMFSATATHIHLLTRVDVFLRHGRHLVRLLLAVPFVAVTVTVAMVLRVLLRVLL
jgi:hypothetical protein